MQTTYALSKPKHMHQQHTKIEQIKTSNNGSIYPHLITTHSKCLSMHIPMQKKNKNPQEPKPYKDYLKRSVYKLDFPKLVNNALWGDERTS